MKKGTLVHLREIEIVKIIVTNKKWDQVPEGLCLCLCLCVCVHPPFCAWNNPVFSSCAGLRLIDCPWLNWLFHDKCERTQKENLLLQHTPIFLWSLGLVSKIFRYFQLKSKIKAKEEDTLHSTFQPPRAPEAPYMTVLTKMWLVWSQVGALVHVQLYTFSYRKAVIRPRNMPKTADSGLNRPNKGTLKWPQRAKVFLACTLYNIW